MAKTVKVKIEFENSLARDALSTKTRGLTLRFLNGIIVLSLGMRSDRDIGND